MKSSSQRRNPPPRRRCGRVRGASCRRRRCQDRSWFDNRGWLTSQRLITVSAAKQSRRLRPVIDLQDLERCAHVVVDSGVVDPKPSADLLRGVAFTDEIQAAALTLSQTCRRSTHPTIPPDALFVGGSPARNPVPTSNRGGAPTSTWQRQRQRGRCLTTCRLVKDDRPCEADATALFLARRAPRTG